MNPFATPTITTNYDTSGSLEDLNMRGPGQVNWDMSLFKTVTIKETLKAQLCREALNAGELQLALRFSF